MINQNNCGNTSCTKLENNDFIQNKNEGSSDSEKKGNSDGKGLLERNDRANNVVLDSKNFAANSDANGTVNASMRELDGRSGNNSYKSEKMSLLSYARNEIKINSPSFNAYLLYAVNKKFHGEHPDKIIVPYLYRVLMESAIKHWMEWFKSPEHQSKFNLKNIKDKEFNIANFLNAPEESSAVTENKINQISMIVLNVKDNEKSKKIKALFNGRSANLPNEFISEVNKVVHGNITDVDIKKLQKYDEMVLKFLKSLSVSME